MWAAEAFLGGKQKLRRSMRRRRVGGRTEDFWRGLQLVHPALRSCNLSLLTIFVIWTTPRYQ